MRTTKVGYMTLLFLSNTLSWLFLHLAISKLMGRMSSRNINRFAPVLRTYDFENNGQLWDAVFKVKRWKSRLPESTLILPESFDQSKMGNTDPGTLRVFIEETKRAEVSHWLSILPVPLFYIWNPKTMRSIHLYYALAGNLPFIIVQRYNRPRLHHLYNLKHRNDKRPMKEYRQYEK